VLEAAIALHDGLAVAAGRARDVFLPSEGIEVSLGIRIRTLGACNTLKCYGHASVLVGCLAVVVAQLKMMLVDRISPMNWTPGMRQRVNPRFAIRCFGVERHWLFVAAWRWLVKRKRAMLESTPPGIASRKLIQTMSGARSSWVVPSLPWIDFPMPS
jgi:hypothetical protein